MKIGIITFHASHNFGSMLQAYALKNYLINQGHNAEIINFRTKNQKDIYSVITKRKGIRYLVKNLYSLSRYFSLKKKHQLFEDFLKEELGCIKEVNNAEEINDMNFDAVIAGSDQIWNVETNDFEWIYFLENITAKKYSYAVSCGPASVKADDKSRLFNNLEKFEKISVRDSATKVFVEENSNKKAEVVCDPVMLLSKKEWENLSSEGQIKKLPKKYIFFYTLSCSKRMKNIVKKISKKLGLKIVVPHNTNQNDLFLKAKKVLVSGPKEFLRLMKEATVVVTSSFHAMLFSIIFDKQFYIIDGLKDNRKRDILLEYHLTEQSIDDKLDLSLIEKQLENNWNFCDIKENIEESGKTFLERILHEDM